MKTAIFICLAIHVILYIFAIRIYRSSKRPIRLATFLSFFIPYIGPMILVVMAYVYHFQQYEYKTSEDLNEEEDRIE